MGVKHTAEATVSAVIVTHNNADVLPACLDSLAQEIACSVLVVDNASTDGTADTVRMRPGVRLLSLDSNLGYAAANNQGLALVETPLTLFLNPDTRFDDGAALAGLIAFLQEHPQAGAVGPRLFWPDGTLQPFAFGDDPTLSYIIRRGLNRLLAQRAMHDWATPTAQRVDWVAGTCLLARTGAVRAAGGWDTSFFMYFEDNDLCRRLRSRGWEIWYDPAVSLVHYGGQADYRDIRRRQVYYRSLLHYYRKHFGFLAWAALAGLLHPYMWLTGMRRGDAVTGRRGDIWTL